MFTAPGGSQIEERRSTCSSRPSVLTRPRPTRDIEVACKSRFFVACNRNGKRLHHDRLEVVALHLGAARIYHFFNRRRRSTARAVSISTVDCTAAPFPENRHATPRAAAPRHPNWRQNDRPLASRPLRWLAEEPGRPARL